MNRTSWRCKAAAVAAVVMAWMTGLGCAGLDAAQQAVPAAERGPAIELGEPYHWTLLHIAARDGELDETRRLLDEGADIDAREHIGRTPLHIAAMWGQREVVELLLERGADVNARDIWDVTPLRRLELLREVRGIEREDIAGVLRLHGGVK